MRRIGLVIVGVGLLGGAREPGNLGTTAKDELARFQGTWQLIAAESNGEKVPEEAVKAIRVTIKGGTHTVRFGEKVVVHDVGFEVDPAATPKQVTDTINEGPQKGQKIRGIYKLEGDTLTSCTATVGGERPSEFSAKKGSGQTLRVFRRVEKGGDAGKAAVEAEQKRFEGSWRTLSIEVEGKALPVQAFKDDKLILKGGGFTSVSQGGTLKGEYVIDPLAMPKTIDVTFIEGPAKGKVHLGIYELEGDTYKVCMGMPGKPRPSEFVSKPGSGHVLEMLEREKP